MAENPLGGMNVVVHVPQKITVKLVDESVFSQFETWIYLCGIFGGAAVNYWTQYSANTTADTNKLLFSIAFVLSIFCTIFFILAMIKRSALKKKTSELTYQQTGNLTSNPDA
jgi:hypothetical protein